MRELDLVSKQPGSHAYKGATVERLDIPNILNREFDVPASNQVWCGDITGTPRLPRFRPTARSPLCPTCSTWSESGASLPKRIHVRGCVKTRKSRGITMPMMLCGTRCIKKAPPALKEAMDLAYLTGQRPDDVLMMRRDDGMENSLGALLRVIAERNA